MINLRISIVLAFLAGACSAPAEALTMSHHTEGRSELGVFMKTHINPAFSKLSFLLFHAEGEDAGDPAATPRTADELSRAAAMLATWSDPPVASDLGKMVFFDYAVSLKRDAATLAEALRMNRRDTAVKTFEALRKKCDSCHHFFRFDESGSVAVQE
jgi:hypothetical protein